MRNSPVPPLLDDAGVRLDRFLKNVKTYLRETAQLCKALASGTVNQQEILERISSLQPTPKFNGQETEFCWLGRARIAQEQPQRLMDPFEYSLIYHPVLLANRFHKRLNQLKPEAREAFDLNAAAEIAKDFEADEDWKDIASENTFQKFKLEVSSAKKLLVADPTGADTIATIPSAAAPATAEEPPGKIEGPVIKRELNSAVIEWKTIRCRVDLKTADAFEAMIKKKGQPTGIRKHVRDTGKWLTELRGLCSELAAIVARGEGNSGWRLTIWDRDDV